MFGGKYKAIIAGKEREIELLTQQLNENKTELSHTRTQLERIYDAVLNLNATKLKRPLGGEPNGLG